jgi:hypothetical protein
MVFVCTCSSPTYAGLLAALAAPVHGGNLLAAGSFAGSVALYDVGSGKCAWMTAAHPHGVTQVRTTRVSRLQTRD